MSHSPAAENAEARPFPFAVRTFNWADLPAIVRIYNRVQESLENFIRTTEAETENYYRSSELNPERDVHVVLNDDGEIVAYSELERTSPMGRTWTDAMVDPAWTGRGIGTYLMRSTEDALRARVLTTLPPESAVSLERYAPVNNHSAIHLFESFGYRYVRSFYRMMVDLDSPGVLELPPLPEGFEVRPVTPDHYPEIYQADVETFRDHWGYEDETFEEWSHWFIESPEADPSLWVAVWHGDRIAAVSLNTRLTGSANPTIGWTNSLGTRREYRKRGLGMYMLRASFRKFAERGWEKAGLGVDAYSLTGAVALYERAGMKIVSQRNTFAKMIQGDWLPLFNQR